MGKSDYDLMPGHESFLTMRLPPVAEALGATIDDFPVRPLRAEPGEWLIPLSDSGPHRVSVVWRSGQLVDAADGTASIPLPEPPGPDVPTLVTLHAPEGIRIQGNADPVTGDVLALERVESLARGIVDRLDPTSLDRSSPRDRTELLSSLVRFEARCGAAERAAALSQSERGSAEGTEISRVEQRILTAREELNAALVSVGLEEFLLSARSRIGLDDRPDPLADLPDIEEHPAVLRIRRLGKPSYYWGNAESGRKLSLRWRKVDNSSPLPQPDHGSALLAIGGLFASGLVLTRQANRAGRSTTLLATVVLIGGLALVTPVGAVVALIVLVLGCVLGQ